MTTQAQTRTAPQVGDGIQAWISEGSLAFGAFTPPELRELTFISSYGADDPDSPAPNHHGYQRNPAPERFPKIGRYYIGAPELATPLIVSVRISDPEEIETFERLVNAHKYREIHETWNSAVVSVVDGQHRRGGLIWAHEHPEENEGVEFSPLIPVMMYFGLTYEQEAELFDIINSEQRKLPKALIETTRGDIVARGEASHAQQIREVAFALARDEDSPWMGQINMTGARDPKTKVTFEGLRRSTNQMFPAELYDRIVARGESPKDYAKYFWTIVRQTCAMAWDDQPSPQRNDETGETVDVPVAYRIKDLVGVASLARLGKDVISSALEYEDPKARIEELVSKLSEVDWRKYDDNPWKSQAGFAGQRGLYNLLFQLVYLDKRPGDPVEAVAA